jgi:hypothetical protein
MLNKSTYLKAIITTFVLCSSVIAVADEAKFKIAVVKNAIGNKNSHVIAFNKNMDSCVALTQAKKVNKSELACTAAINSIKSIKGNNKKARYLESLSYSNRGISRYMNDDLVGATDDLIAAFFIDSNSITQSNLKLIKNALSIASNNNASTNVTE